VVVAAFTAVVVAAFTAAVVAADIIRYSTAGALVTLRFMAAITSIASARTTALLATVNSIDSLPTAVAASTMGRVVEEDDLRADSVAAVLAPAVFMVVGDSVTVEGAGSTAGEVEAATTSIGFIR
jgi:hypothetical protein